ncbi:alpha/beta hydrolase [Mucilaginibacter sp. FT3.2]|uniref:alpha/beta hydrolase n=1 Tax=Mucilaginibacter sp. FT3.2 TaxID=2723090 RepID=UPI00160FA2E1|nr:alpha/beta hydrolase-fold protein [Mucilaginibacter sp. FT3.2]MBB6232590.1 enterochelin esterase-like enzyme [Mucilaginibacter sp. FT3.2]
MPFKTTEISNQQFESNNLRFITVKSSNLKGRGDICVYVPPGAGQAHTLPIVILLHGVYGSAWSWALSSGVHLKVNQLIELGELPPMILAMPSDGLWGDGSGYLPNGNHNFEQWIAGDVPAAIRENIVGAKKDSPLFISGLSMGGFGALRIGAKYGHLFRAISGMSSITSLPQIKLFVEEPLKYYAQDNVVDEDVFATFKHYRHQLPPVRFDCGTNDLLIRYNRDLHKKMEQAGMPHIYEEYGGGHEWSYWAKHVVTTLKFFSGHL